MVSRSPNNLYFIRRFLGKTKTRRKVAIKRESQSKCPFCTGNKRSSGDVKQNRVDGFMNYQLKKKGSGGIGNVWPRLWRLRITCLRGEPCKYWQYAFINRIKCHQSSRIQLLFTITLWSIYQRRVGWYDLCKGVLWRPRFWSCIKSNCFPYVGQKLQFWPWKLQIPPCSYASKSIRKLPFPFLFLVVHFNHTIHEVTPKKIKVCRFFFFLQQFSWGWCCREAANPTRLTRR